ncbi:MAG: SDR family oxidoreductase [Leptolyngbya sp. RL_3_1]|nr:SDR family oxidoreductase [Leptolyngbya sp. RL_3_1]
MKVAIVGCGYVGTAVAQHWQAQGLTVLATTTCQERVSELATVADRIEVLQGDDAEHLRAALADQQVVLLSVAPKRGGSYADTYLSTAKTMAQILPQTDVQQLIYTSTSSVYGQHQGAWVTETTPIAPTSDNGKVIAAAEETLLAAMTDQQQVCILRLGGIYGPGRTLEKIYGRAAGTTRPGKGDERSNWVHLDDIVGAIDWARRQQLSGLYNVVQDEVPTVRELISAVCRRYGLEPVQWDETQPSSRFYNARVANAKLKATGYRFVHPRFWPEGD